MHIETLQIKDYRGISDLSINFRVPKKTDGKKSNAVNVLVGKNGSGKTTLLELISNYYKTGFDIDENSVVDLGLVDYPKFSVLEKIISGEFDQRYRTNLHNEVRKLTANQGPPYEHSQIIYLPALINLERSGAALNQLDLSYSFSHTVKTNIIQNAEIYIKDYIVAQERLIESSSYEERSRRAIDIFNAHYNSLRSTTFLHTLDPKRLNKPVFKNISGDELSIDDLSDGEKQIYSRLIGLMMLEPNNSIILIDEPEAALHPAWQYKILDLYSSIGSGNQFIFATHSPQVIASTSWKNIQVLTRTKNGVQINSLNGPPAGSDGSSILEGIMGVERQPKAIEDKKRKYRDLYARNEGDSTEAQSLRTDILESENEDSVFFQELEVMRLISESRG